MRLKRFRAASMGAAFAAIRQEFGGEAVILATVRLKDGVEVTAGIDPPAKPAMQAATTPEHGLRFAAADLAKPLFVTGPPGAGKTLTIARLATRLVLAGIKPLVITTDGARAGAAEQLAAFTTVLGLDLVAAPSATLLARAKAAALGPVLIDSAGINPHSARARADASALALAAGAQALLVLPAGLDQAECIDIASGFAEAGATGLVATRLDTARRVGGILAAAQILPLVELGVGPGAADGLQPARPETFAPWLANAVRAEGVEQCPG